MPGGDVLKASFAVSPEFGDTEYLPSIQGHILRIVALDNRFGGADLVGPSAGLFRTLRDQLGAGTCDPRLERDLHSAAAELAGVVGWLAYDAEAHELARRMNRASLSFARRAGDKSIERLTLQNSSMHAAAQGRPAEALWIARSVLEGGGRLSPRLKALFLTRKARALAQGGDHSALRMLPEIRSLFLEGVGDGDPPWAWWIDERELTWHEAMIQRDLGWPGRAIAQFERSVLATPAAELRSQYLHRAYLLQAHVDIRTWDGAEREIRHLLPLAAQVASTRTAVLLRAVLRRLPAGAKVPLSLQEQAAILSAVLDEAPSRAGGGQDREASPLSNFDQRRTESILVRAYQSLGWPHPSRPSHQPGVFKLPGVRQAAVSGSQPARRSNEPHPAGSTDHRAGQTRDGLG